MKVIKEGKVPKEWHPHVTCWRSFCQAVLELDHKDITERNVERGGGYGDEGYTVIVYSFRCPECGALNDLGTEDHNGYVEFIDAMKARGLL